MARIIVRSTGDMPAKAQGGLPLGCVLDNDKRNEHVVAYGPGSSWGRAGVEFECEGMLSYTAYLPPDDPDEGPQKIELHAVDMPAALMWLKAHFRGPFVLYVNPAPIYLGEFKS